MTALGPAVEHARYYLVHLVEECARHAGHAEIIREQSDRVAVPALVLTSSSGSGRWFRRGAGRRRVRPDRIRDDRRRCH